MRNKNKKVVFGLTAAFFAIVTAGLYIFGAELCEMYPIPGFAAKVEMIKMVGPIATVCSVFLAIKKEKLKTKGYNRVQYRPQRGSLEESMRESREFASIEEMFTTIALESNGLFNAEDLLIEADIINDERIGWNETRVICTKHYGDLRYDIPQCIGFCNITINHSLTGE